MAPSTCWYLYIIETEGGRLYTGITTDPARRFDEHRSGRGAKFFRTDPPRRQVYRQTFPDRASASREECRVKRLPRAQKLLLIAGEMQVKNPEAEVGPL